MKLVIIGAGSMGRAIASMLSKEHHDIILVERDRTVLERAAQDLDVLTRLGSGTDWNLQDELKELNPDLLLALTDSDETNLVCCSVAKALGYPQTIARVRQSPYLSQTRLDFGRLFSVDHFVSPELLAAQDICKHVLTLGSVEIENFALGSVQMRTLVIPAHWKYVGTPLSQLELPAGVMAGLIARPEAEGKGYQIIFPHGKDVFMPGDEATMIGESESMHDIHHFFGIQQERVQSAVIVGGGQVGVHVVKALQGAGIRCKVIERDRKICEELSEMLPNAVIIHHDGTDLNILHEESVQRADVFIACTGVDETNVLAALLARNVGCKHIIAVISDAVAAAMLKELGISRLVSPQTSAADRILAISEAGVISASVSLYEKRAQVLELKVSLDSKIVGIPLHALGPYLPRDFLIAVIQSRGRTMVAHGKRILSPGDTAIVVTAPSHVEEVLEIF